MSLEDAARSHPPRRRGAAAARRGDAGGVPRARRGGARRRRSSASRAPPRAARLTSDRAKELVQTSQEAMTRVPAQGGRARPGRGRGHDELRRRAASSSTEIDRRLDELERRLDELEKNEAEGQAAARLRRRALRPPLRAEDLGPRLLGDRRERRRRTSAGAYSKMVRPWLCASSTFTDQPSTVLVSSAGTARAASRGSRRRAASSGRASARPA